MTPIEFDLLVCSISVVAGLLGSLLGLGGGIIVVPALTLLLGIDIRYAVGASIVSVIATSSGAAAVYVHERMTNLRVATVLELATTSGALTGAYVAGWVPTRYLYVVFGLVMGYSCLKMLRKYGQSEQQRYKRAPWADYLRLHGSYFDKSLGREVTYQVVSTRVGLGLMYLAGVVSGLLGIGSGALKVPALDLAMRMPIKVSTATSNLMIGVTAAASAGVYFMRGDIDPFVAAPVALGVLIGAIVGSRWLGRLRGDTLRVTFIVVLLVIALQMLWKGVRG